MVAQRNRKRTRNKEEEEEDAGSGVDGKRETGVEEGHRGEERRDGWGRKDRRGVEER